MRYSQRKNDPEINLIERYKPLGLMAVRAATEIRPRQSSHPEPYQSPDNGTLGNEQPDARALSSIDQVLKKLEFSVSLENLNSSWSSTS
ncbi:hypothetical protein ATY79_14985 [Rhizobium sp. R693]|nr:hypothetical protein ATY79_14985 [Rhizobium sp. R693]